jgi:hypothetical protein
MLSPNWVNANTDSAVLHVVGGQLSFGADATLLVRTLENNRYDKVIVEDCSDSITITSGATLRVDVKGLNGAGTNYYILTVASTDGYTNIGEFTNWYKGVTGTTALSGFSLTIAGGLGVPKVYALQEENRDPECEAIDNEEGNENTTIPFYFTIFDENGDTMTVSVFASGDGENWDFVDSADLESDSYQWNLSFGSVDNETVVYMKVVVDDGIGTPDVEYFTITVHNT